MSKGYTATLEQEQVIYIANWSPAVALGNLTQAGKYIGIDSLLAISKLDKMATHTTILAIAEAEDADNTMELIQHFVCSAAMDGERITRQNFDIKFENELYLAIEIFCHVVHSQYASFFEQGLVEG